MADHMDSIPSYHTTKESNLQLCQNNRTISLISHPSKVILKIILNRLQPQAEEFIVEELAGFRAGRSTTEQIFNLMIICQKYLQHQQNLYHVFIDFKKAFDRVWHEALRATIRKYSINASFIRAIENLSDKAQGAVLLNGSIGEWFRTTVGFRQWCLQPRSTNYNPTWFAKSLFLCWTLIYWAMFYFET